MDVNNIKLMEWDVKLPFNMFSRMLMINHPPVIGAYETGIGEYSSTLCGIDDSEAVKKTVNWWANNKGPDVNSEIWGSFAKEHEDFRTALDAGLDNLSLDSLVFSKKYNVKNLSLYLGSMFEQPITDGLAQGSRYTPLLKDNFSEHVENTGAAIYDKFISLFEGVGIIPTFSPEDYQKEPRGMLKYYTVEIDKYLQILEDHYGLELKAPEFQGGHFGIKTNGHNLYSDRDIMSLFVAIRIAERYWDIKDKITICDLGGGVGHLAFYLTKFGFKNITLIEVPTVAAAATYFLEINLPGNNIEVKTGEDFDAKYDFIVNVDGLTGYGLNQARKYSSKIMKEGKHFLSINKESDEVKIMDLMTGWRRATRTPFWLRRGYIEEDYVR